MIKFKKTRAGKFYFTVDSVNGFELMKSKKYTFKQNALKAMKSIIYLFRTSIKEGAACDYYGKTINLF